MSSFSPLSMIKEGITMMHLITDVKRDGTLQENVDILLTRSTEIMATMNNKIMSHNEQEKEKQYYDSLVEGVWHLRSKRSNILNKHTSIKNNSNIINNNHNTISFTASFSLLKVSSTLMKCLMDINSDNVNIISSEVDSKIDEKLANLIRRTFIVISQQFKSNDGSKAFDNLTQGQNLSSLSNSKNIYETLNEMFCLLLLDVIKFSNYCKENIDKLKFCSNILNSALMMIVTLSVAITTSAEHCSSPRRRFEVFTNKSLSATLQLLEILLSKNMLIFSKIDEKVIIGVISSLKLCIETCLFSSDDENVFDELSAVHFNTFSTSEVSTENTKSKKNKKSSSKSKDISSSDSKFVKSNRPTSFYSALFETVSHAYIEIGNYREKTNDCRSSCGMAVTFLFSIFSGCSFRLLGNIKTDDVIMTGNEDKRQSSEVESTSNIHHDGLVLLASRKHCGRLLHVCLALIQSIDIISESINNIKSTQINQSENKIKKVKIDNASDNIILGKSSLLRDYLRYQIHVTLLSGLAESLSNSGSIPNHDSMNIYINELKSLSHNALSRFYKRNSEIDLNLSKYNLLLLSADLDCVRILADVDHRTVTAEGTRKVVSLLVEAENLLIENKININDEDFFCKEILRESSEMLVLRIIDLYVDLRKMDDFIHAFSIENINKNSTSDSLSRLLCCENIRLKLVDALSSMPGGQIEKVWEAIVGKDETSLDSNAEKSIIEEDLMLKSKVAMTERHSLLIQCMVTALRDNLGNNNNGSPIEILTVLLYQAEISIGSITTTSSLISNIHAYSGICALLQLASKILPHSMGEDTQIWQPFLDCHSNIVYSFENTLENCWINSSFKGSDILIDNTVYFLSALFASSTFAATAESYFDDGSNIDNNSVLSKMVSKTDEILFQAILIFVKYIDSDYHDLIKLISCGKKTNSAVSSKKRKSVIPEVTGQNNESLKNTVISSAARILELLMQTVLMWQHLPLSTDVILIIYLTLYIYIHY
jgi:hypothetical protein